MSSERDLFQVVQGIDGNTDTVYSSIISETGFVHIQDKIREFIASDPTYDYTQEEGFINILIYQAVCLSNLMALSGYQNVLVIPSFRNSAFSTLFNQHTKNIRPNLMNQLWPIVSLHFGVGMTPYIAYPEGHTSFAKSLTNHFRVPELTSNHRFTIGDDTYSIPNCDVSFDAVFLAGHDLDPNVVYNADDIKADLAAMCQPDFDLIDFWDDVEHFDENNIAVKNGVYPVPHPRPERLLGETKDLREMIEYINSNSVKLNDGDAPEFANIIPRISRALNREFKVY